MYTISQPLRGFLGFIRPEGRRGGIARGGDSLLLASTGHTAGMDDVLILNMANERGELIRELKISFEPHFRQAQISA